MGKNTASYKFEKRKKELARQKKQEEKRRRHLERKQEKPEDSQTNSADESLLNQIEGINTKPTV